MPSLTSHLVQQIVAVAGAEYVQYCAFVDARSFADALRVARLGRGLVWAPVARGGYASSDFLHYSCGPAHEMYYSPSPI